MTIDDLCEQYGGIGWVGPAMDGFLDDLAEHHRTPAPHEVRAAGFRERVEWLVGRCRPAYTPDEIDDYLIDCQQP
jgi:hypothetical protein